MNRSGRGFGLTGVAVAVAVMIVVAVFSTTARSSEQNILYTENLTVVKVSAPKQNN